MQLVHLNSSARPVVRPGCSGMSAAAITHGETWEATALYFSARATSDDHAVAYDQSFVITRGSGRVSVGEETMPVHAGDAVQLPRAVFHRYWTEGETMDAVALAFNRIRGPKVVRVSDRAALARNAAERFVLIARQAMAEHHRMSVALSGGSTPRDLFALLATPEFALQVDWSRVHCFWGDERAVAPDDPASNFRMAQEALLSHVPLPPENVHRMMAEHDPQTAAREYAQALRTLFGAADHPSAAPGAWPPFDLVLLGLGENGHTASLFPHTAVLDNTADWVAAEYIDEVKMNRITLTAPVINAAEHVLFLVSGAEKAATARAVLRGEYRPADLPAQLIRPTAGELVWLLDRAAAGEL